MKLPRVLSILTALYLALSFAPAASAQLTIVVSPPRYDAEVDPGEVIQKTIKVTNPSETDSLTLRTFVTDFIVQDDAGTPIKVTESASGRYLASPWFTLDQEEITLAPRETGQVIAVVTVPDDALPGGHYAGVFFEPVTQTSASGTATILTAQVGSLFGITVAGDLAYDALIKDFATGSRLYEYGPVDFTAIVENQSDTHIRPQSQIVIRNMLGSELEVIPLTELNIFPFTSRSLEGTWDTIWGLGRYTATLEVTYGPGLVADRTLFFWLLPYRLIAAILVVLLVLIVTYISIRRHLHHRADGRDDEIDALKRRIVELENRQ